MQKVFIRKNAQLLLDCQNCDDADNVEWYATECDIACGIDKNGIRSIRGLTLTFLHIGYLKTLFT